ncbi:MAG: hypothetical protein WB679_22955 [Terracidiphilus sp.]
MSEQLDSFVESTVVRLIFDREASELRVEVSCVFGERKKRAIVARGIDDCLIEDLGVYNIIDRVTVFAPEQAVEESNECTSTLLYLKQQRELSASDLAWPAFKEKLAMIRSGQLQLMTVEAVVGASATVLAKEITFE